MSDTPIGFDGEVIYSEPDDGGWYYEQEPPLGEVIAILLSENNMAYQDFVRYIGHGEYIDYHDAPIKVMAWRHLEPLPLRFRMDDIPY